MKEFISETYHFIHKTLSVLIYFFFEWSPRHFYSIGIFKNFTCLTGKTAIVTGGNAGIGLGTSLLLASRGCKVIIACRRDAINERDRIIKETNNPNIIVKHLDLCNFESVRIFAEQIKKEEKKIDILINNAGIGHTMDTCSEDGLDKVMQSNYFGHFLLTHLLIDLLKAAEDARIVFLTSTLAALNSISVKRLYPSRNTVEMMRSYPNSKVCCIIATQEMAKKLEKFGIKVNCADPGVSETQIFDSLEGQEEGKFFVRNFSKLMIFIFARDTITAASTSFHLATRNNVGNGLVFFRGAPISKPLVLNDKKLCEEIWAETEKIVKLSPEERI